MRERERVKSDQGKLNNLGFTLIELLVVISIIGFLATSAIVLLNSARIKARDVRRKSDLNQVMKALSMYQIDYSTFCVQNAGAGGNGWLNHPYGSPFSVAKQLVNLGYMGSEARDPTEPGNTQGYMIRCEASHVTLWATMEGASTLDDCYHSSYDTGYGKNYCISQ